MRGAALPVAALLAGLAAMAWQPVAVQAEVQTAGWHSAGSQTGDIQQATYCEPISSPADNSGLRWKARSAKPAAEQPLAAKLKPATIPALAPAVAKPKSEIQQVTYTEPSSEPRGDSGPLRWKARRAKAAIEPPAAKLTSATECLPTPATPKPTPPASISSRSASRYKWGKLGIDPWGDLGLEASATDDADTDANSETVDELDSGLARLSTVRQAEGQMPIDPADEAPKAKLLPPLAIPDGSDAALDSDSPAARTAQRRPIRATPEMPSFEEAFVQGPQSLEVDCNREREKLKPINAITNKIAAEPGDFPPECDLGNPVFKPRCYPEMTYAWKASNLCHKPLYFEQYAVERYGHALPPVIEPVFAAGHFFVDVLLLPYHMGLELPQECVYSLGYYRPGACAPMHIDGFPISARAAAFQAGAILGGTAIFGSL